jgi:sugar-specific transcriptional regulator TrmB
VNKNYPNIMKFLRGLKGLSVDEAKAFIELCNKDTFNVNEVKQILSKLNVKVSKTKTYDIVNKFSEEQLIFLKDDEKRAKRYQALHPNALLTELKTDLKKLDIEVSHLTQSYETSDYEDEDPRTKSRILKSEGEIISECHKICSDSSIHIVYNDSNEFINKISETGVAIKGDINVILFKNKDKNVSGIISLSKRHDKEGNLRFFGQILFDEEKYEYYFKNEVGKVE